MRSLLSNYGTQNLFVTFLVLFIFFNEELVRFIFYDLQELYVIAIDPDTAWSSAAFSFGLCLVVLCLIRWQDIQLLHSSLWSQGKSFGTAFGWIFGLRVMLGIFWRVLGGTGGMLSPDAFLVTEIELQAMLTHCGYVISFILICGLVPIFEEYLFRGVILSACEKHVGFMWANIIQSGLFAVVHDSLELAPFYFVFGILAGVLRKRSDSLAAPIYFHGINNVLAMIAVVLRS